MRKRGFSLASIGQAAKKNLQLTPKSKPKKNGGRARRHRRSRDGSLSSSASSFDEESSYSEISDSDFSSSYSEESKVERYSRSRKGKDRQYHRSRADKRNYNEKDRRRSRRRGRDRHSPDSYGEFSTPQRHVKNPNMLGGDDSAQMIDLLMSILPFYGKGDGHSDAVVIDTIHRLPPHALEMQDMDGNTLLLLACQAGAFNLMPILLGRGCNVNTRNNVGASCLHFACFVESFSPDAAMALVRHGAVAEVAEHEFGCTPLHWAAFSGHVELCATLCRAGGNPNTLDKNGCDPIHYSNQNGHTACAQLLGSFTAKKVRAATSPAATATTNAASPSAPPDESEWVRCLDGSTGSSFYHNKDTGESLWGDEYREADQPSVVGIKPPPGKVEPKEAKSDGKESEADKSLSTISNIVSESDGDARDLNAIKQAPSHEIDLDTCQHVPLSDISATLSSLDKVTKVIEETKLTAIVEDLDETSSNEKVEPAMDTDMPQKLPPEKESQLADIVEDLVETSSIEDAEPSLITAQTEGLSMTDKKEEHCNVIVDSGKKPSTLSRLNSWDVDFYAEEEKKNELSPQKDMNKLSAETSDANDKVDRTTDETQKKVDESAASNTEAAKTNNLVAHDTAMDSNTNLVRNQSFEERISSLHQKMESQLLHRLQHLEDKITQQNLETSMKVEDDSSELKQHVTEMTSTIFELRTEVGTKDLEILSLKQQVVKMETEKISEMKSSMNVCVGDGNVHDESMKVENEKLEQELQDARDEAAQLKDQIHETTKSLNVANGRYEQSERHLEIAEQLARDEKASRISMKSLMEQAQTGELDAASLEQKEKHQAEETIIQLRDRMRAIEDKSLEERNDHQQELESMGSELLAAQSRATVLENKFEKTVTMHKTSLDKLNDHHKEELEQLKEELNGVQEQLRDAKMARMELMVAKDEAVDSMENALEKARSAETKLQEMTDLVMQTGELKKSNEQLHNSLQDEREKRKVLHNTLEDMKGRIRVYVRVRPLSKTELRANYVNVMTKEDDRTCVMAGDAATASDVRDWEFDKIFNGSDADGNTQENVFKDTSLLITSAIDGFNVCIFAYGQTGSGKTFTMLGAGDGDDQRLQGLAPRVAHELFRKLRERESSHHIEVTASMLELYTDKLRDLLATSNNENECLGDLKIRLAEHTTSGLVEVDGAKIQRVADAEELLEVFDKGTKGRTSSSTKMNAESSRSHMVATVVLSLRNRRTGKIVHGKLTLVDLAGSERVSKSGATGHQLKEAQSINKSLSALGDVIGALTSGGRQHIPYRNHPLTMLMSDSIGGNAKTLMFVCCSPADYNRKETANSLDFAKRCRNVTNNAVASKGSKGSSASQLKALRAELSKIKERERGNGTVKRRPVGMRRPGM